MLSIESILLALLGISFDLVKLQTNTQHPAPRDSKYRPRDVWNTFGTLGTPSESIGLSTTRFRRLKKGLKECEEMEKLTNKARDAFVVEAHFWERRSELRLGFAAYRVVLYFEEMIKSTRQVRGNHAAARIADAPSPETDVERVWSSLGPNHAQYLP